MKNRKWQRVLSWLLTLTMLLGTFESNILAVNAMDDEAVEAEVAEADEDVEEPEVVGASSKEDASGVTITGSGVVAQGSATDFEFESAYGKNMDVFATFKASKAGDAVTWKLFEADSWKEATLIEGLNGVANNDTFTISGTPTVAETKVYKLSAVSSNGTASANATVKISVAPVDVATLDISGANDLNWNNVKMGYTVDAAAASSSTNVVPKTISITNNYGADLSGLTIKLEGADKDCFELTGAGTDLSIAANGTLTVTVKPKTGLTVTGKAKDVAQNFSADVSLSANYLDPVKLVAPVSFDLKHDMDVTVTKDGAAFNKKEITVSAGNVMPQIALTATGGIGDKAWSGDVNEFPKDITGAGWDTDTLTLSGKVALDSSVTNKDYVLNLEAKDQKNKTEGNNTFAEEFTIKVVSANVIYTVDGEETNSVTKLVKTDSAQAKAGITVKAANPGDSKIKVKAVLAGADANAFSIFSDAEQEIAPGAEAEFTVYPKSVDGIKTVDIEFTGEALVSKTVTFNLIAENDTIVIAKEQLPKATVGKAYSYTFKAETTAGEAKDIVWSISDNSATTADGLKDLGLSLSSDGILSGTPKTAQDSVEFTVSASLNGVVSNNTVTLKIEKTGDALVVTDENGTKLTDEKSSASANGVALALPAVATSIEDIKGVSANVVVENVSSVKFDGVTATISDIKMKDASGEYTIDNGAVITMLDGSLVANLTASNNSTEKFTVVPNVDVIKNLTPSQVGSYRALVTVDTNANIADKKFYVTIDITNSPVVNSFKQDGRVVDNNNNSAKYNFTNNIDAKVNEAIKSVSFSAVSKNSTDVTKTLKNVSWTWEPATANGTLPEGLTLSEAGIISGTPTQAGDYTVSVNVLDKDTNLSATATVTVEVEASGEIILSDGVKPIIGRPFLFPGVVQGAANAGNGRTVVIKNIGDADISDLKISVVDAGTTGTKGSKDHFTVDKSSIASLAKNEMTSITITPTGTDKAGMYGAYVEVSANTIETKSVPVLFVVAEEMVVEMPSADKLSAKVGAEYSLSVNTSTVSANSPFVLSESVKWTEVSANGVAYSGNNVALDGTGLLLGTNPGKYLTIKGTPVKAGSYAVSVNALIEALTMPDSYLGTEVNVAPSQSANFVLNIEVAKSASVNVVKAEGETAADYAKGEANKGAIVTEYTFANRSVGYTAAGTTESVKLTVSNASAANLTVSANLSSDKFEIDPKTVQTIDSGKTFVYTVNPVKNLEAGTYTADLKFFGEGIEDQIVKLSFTVEEAKDAVSLSANNATVGDEGITLIPAKEKDNTTIKTTTVNINNIGNVKVDSISVVEVKDAEGTSYAIGATDQKLTIGALNATSAVPGKDVNFTVAPKNVTNVGEFTAYIKVTYTVGKDIKDGGIYKVNYTVYKKSVSVNVTPSANTVSINGTASVSENYSTAYSVGFSVANGEAGVAGDTTETLYDLRVALTGTDADKFVLTAEKVDEKSAEYGAAKVVKGASYSFNIAAKSGLSYGVYKATLEVSASNMTTITKEIVFTVTGKAGSYTKDINSKGVSDNVAVNANRIRNTLQAQVDNSVAGVTVNTTGDVFTVQKDITVEFNTNGVEIKLNPKHSISTDSISVNRNGKTANAPVGDRSYYDTIYFNIYNTVSFNANGGKFADGSDIVSVNVVNGGKVAELPSVSKNNASLKAWMDENLNEFTSATVVKQDMDLTAAWSAHTYPASASGNKAGQIEWTWNGTASDNFAGTFVTIYCTDTDCPDKAASAIKLDATITVSGKDASCTKGEAKVYTATAAKDGNVYTDTTTVAGEEGLGHKWVVDASNPVWAEDYSSVSINKTCEAAYHTSEDGDKTVAIVTKNISFNGAEATCTTSGNGVYTATFTSEDDPAISENIVVSVNAAEVPALGHDYKVKAEWTDNGFENTPSVNAVLVCSRCEEVVSENLTVSVELVSENEAKKDYKAVVTYEDKTYESATYSVMNHTEHSWSVSFNWTGTTSENAVVEAIATCANGGETVVLSPDVEKKVTSKNVTYTATVKDPDGKEWSEKYTVNLESGEGKVGGGEGIEIRDLEDSYLVTGAQIKPAITVWDLTRDVQLAESVDYKVTYGKNKAAGEGSVTVVGKGNYSGKNVTATFTIVDPVKEMDPEEVAALAAVKGAKIAKIDAATFTGSAIYPETISVKTKKDGTIVMKSNGDGTYDVEGEGKAVVVAVTNNIKAGKATVAVTGSDAKTVKKTFKINKADISTATIEASEAVYAVKGATPEIKVTWKASEDADEIELVQGMDYKVKYDKAAKKVGTASFTITGKGNFAKKSAATSFEIKALDLSDIDEEAIAVNASVGMKAGKVKVTVVDGNGTVIPAKNYKVEVFQGEGEAALGAKDKLAEGDATIKITGTDNLTESVEKSIVVASSISKAKVKVNKNLVKTYTGEAITLDDEDFNNIDVTLKGTKLVYGTDFVVASYANNIKKGKMTVTIEGIGQYSGTKTFKVKIAAQEMKPAE